jgi:uncharacterized protein YdaU (DUF1376 family)
VQERDFVMARTKPPSFDFFPDDFIAGTYHLTPEAVGIYVRLLCYQWNNGSIPSDENELARVAGVDADAMRTHMRTVMLKFMQDECGGLKNARLEREREHKLSVIEKSKAAADSRWAKEKARKDAESAKKSGCVGNADAYADGYADAMRTDMPPTSNFQLPTSNSLNPPLSPIGGKTTEEEKPKAKRKPSETVGEFQPPKRLDTPEVRQALADFESMRLRTGKRIKDRSNVCRGWDSRFVDAKHLLACIDVAISNEYQGISPDYIDPSKVLEAKKPSLWDTAKKY